MADSVSAKVPIRVVSFDLDGTLVTGTTADLFFADVLGNHEDVVNLEARYAVGDLDSRVFCRELASLQSELTLELIEQHIDALPLIADVAPTLAALHEHGLLVGVVSSSGQHYLDALARRFRFDFVHGTQHAIAGGRIGAGREICDAATKAHFVTALANQLAISLDQWAAVGDSRSDLEIFAIVGCAIALNGDESVRDRAHHYLSSQTLRAVLPLLIGTR